MTPRELRELRQADKESVESRASYLRQWRMKHPDKVASHEIARRIRVHTAQPNEALIRYRQEKGLSQGQLAIQFGVTRNAISAWERGIVRTPELVMRVLGIEESEVKDD